MNRRELCYRCKTELRYDGSCPRCQPDKVAKSAAEYLGKIATRRELKLANLGRQVILGTAILMLASIPIGLLLFNHQIHTARESQADRDELEALTRLEGLLPWLLAMDAFAASMFFALWIYAKRRPFRACLVAFLVFAALWAVSIALGNRSGIFVRLFVLGALGFGASKSREYEALVNVRRGSGQGTTS